MSLPLNVVKFSNGNTKPYEMAKDYFFHYMSEVQGVKYGAFDSSVSIDKKEEKANAQLLSEVSRLAGQSKPEGVSFEQWATNPMVGWAVMAVSSIVIDAVIPDTILKDVGIFAETKTIGIGDSAEYTIKPNSLMTVSQGSNAQRTTFKTKQFKTTKTLIPINHVITVEVSLYAVLAGKESLADFIRKAILSQAREMGKDAYGALTTLIDKASFPTQLKKTGYDVDTLLNLCEVVTAYNQGAKATIVGTATALNKVIPSSANGYRIMTPSNDMGIQLIKNFFDYDIIKLNQVATGKNYGLLLDDKKLYVMSPSGDKIIKGAMEGSTMSNTRDFFDTADLTSDATFNKRWIFEAITNSTMGVIEMD